MKTKFLIGTIANQFGISKQTLIYYDKIGLLSPAEKVDNHYRYYTYEQFDMLDVILSLKETGMSLTEIKSYLENRTLEKSIGLLKKQTATIENRIEQLNNIQIKLNKRLTKLEEFKAISTTNDIQKVIFPERKILRVTVENQPDHVLAIGNAFKTLSEQLSSDSDLALYTHLPSCVSLSKDSVLAGSFTTIQSVFLEIEYYKDSIYYDTIPSNTYVCLHHHGTYEDSDYSYQRLIQYLDIHNYKIIGDSLEIPRIDGWSVSKETDYITEIQVPIAEL